MTELRLTSVTGGTRFMEGHTAAHDDRGAEVTALDASSRVEALAGATDSRDMSAYNWKYLRKAQPDAGLIGADIRESDRLGGVVESHDGVVHTMDQVVVSASSNGTRTVFEMNAAETVDISEAARAVDFEMGTDCLPYDTSRDPSTTGCGSLRSHTADEPLRDTDRSQSITHDSGRRFRAVDHWSLAFDQRSTTDVRGCGVGRR